ncbi:hypothetical protein [uncultured Anaerofustis sp.]|uniref:hypothetical protein n=1 Tax=uncultured Anaerofustis sp. TaxID=904996 RepID=UPI0025F4C973|nr:hypothetical protein [uncultured Anaerofustis sp.]
MKKYNNMKKLFIILFLTAVIFLIFSIIKQNYYIMGFTTSISLCSLILLISYKIKEKNKEKFEAMINEFEDERLIFIENNAKSMTLNLSIYILAIGCFITGLMEYKEISIFLSIPMVIILILYLGSYLYYKKKY